MALSHSSHVEANQCTFTDVGRDVNFNGRQMVQIQISGLTLFSLFSTPVAARRTSPLDLRKDSDTLSWAPSVVEISSQNRVTVPIYDLPEGIETIGITTRLIVEIFNLLVGPHVEQPPEDLKLELIALHKSLVMAGTAMQEYKDRPLGQSLVNAVTPEVKRCCIALAELFDRANGTRWGLSQTSILRLWVPVHWSRWGGDEVTILKRKLSKTRQSLLRFLMAMNSVAWTDLGNDLSTGPVSLRKFYTLLRQHLPSPSLHHIQLETLSVVDHLGQNILVPTMFCSTWKDFHHIITGFCRGRVGNHYVEQGDYQVISPADNRRIEPTQLAQRVKAGMVLEMSIVVHQMSAFQDSKVRCPRCGHINLGAIASDSNGWIECRCCSGQFQAERAAHSSYDNNGDSGRGTAPRNNGLELGEEDAGGQDEENSEAAVSPGCNHSLGNIKQEDETHFFRRINVIYTEHLTVDIPPELDFPTSSHVDSLQEQLSDGSALAELWECIPLHTGSSSWPRYAPDRPGLREGIPRRRASPEKPIPGGRPGTPSASKSKDSLLRNMLNQHLEDTLIDREGLVRMVSDDEVPNDRGQLDLNSSELPKSASSLLTNQPSSLPNYASLSRSTLSQGVLSQYHRTNLNISGGISRTPKDTKSGNRPSYNTFNEHLKNTQYMNERNPSKRRKGHCQNGPLNQSGASLTSHLSPVLSMVRSHVGNPQQPLPPVQLQGDRPTEGAGQGVLLHAVPASWQLFIVEFKGGRTDLFYRMEPSQDIRVGDLVTVEGDRGKDLGKVISNSVTLAEVRAFQRQQMERAGCAQASGPEDVRPTSAVAATGQKEILLKMLYKKAQQDPDASFLVSKVQDELKALQFFQKKVRARKLPMKVVDAEYQWDRRKLTFYFVATKKIDFDKRVDFKELVKELNCVYKTIIWMVSLPDRGGLNWVLPNQKSTPRKRNDLTQSDQRCAAV